MKKFLTAIACVALLSGCVAYEPGYGGYPPAYYGAAPYSYEFGYYDTTYPVYYGGRHHAYNWGYWHGAHNDGRHWGGHWHKGGHHEH